MLYVLLIKLFADPLLKISQKVGTLLDLLIL